MTAAFGAARVRAMPRGGLVELLRLGRSLGAVDLASGVPGWPTTPDFLIEAACEALRTGDNQYDHPDGNLELREHIARSLATPAGPDEITVTVGASEGLCIALLATVDPGDEVVLLEPFYENFASAIAMTGGRPVYVRRHGPGWRWDSGELRSAFGPRTRAVLINSPCNPTGRVLDEDELAELAELCARWDVTVISDEAYAALVFDGRSHISAADVPGLRERAIVLGSFSKSHAISGWRIGYLRASRTITQVLRQVHIATSCGAPAPLQQAAASAEIMTNPAWDPLPELQKRRDRVVELLTRAGFDCLPPEGGCYVFAGIRGLTDLDCDSFSRWLAAERRVLLAPGRYFTRDPDSDSGLFRVTFNKSDETLAAAEENLRDLR